MEMRKINERIYEFFDLNYEGQIEGVETLEEEVIEEVELSITAGEFFGFMSSILEDLTVEDAESIGLF
jgi:hypothetical protein